MNPIESIATTENVSLITLHDSPAEIPFVARVFNSIADAGINVDMIAQAAPFGSRTTLSFTVADADIPRTLETLSSMRDAGAGFKQTVSSGNVKLSVYSEIMRNASGIASRVFDAVASIHADVRMITTSEVDISLLLAAADTEAAVRAITEAFDRV